MRPLPEAQATMSVELRPGGLHAVLEPQRSMHDNTYPQTKSKAAERVSLIISRILRVANGCSNRITEYENRIHRLEAMLQEQNDAQPHFDQQPLQPADPSVPATEWVAGLRNVMPTIRRPDLTDFEAMFGEPDEDSVPIDDPTSNAALLFPSHDYNPVPDVAAPAYRGDFEPSNGFQANAVDVQGNAFDSGTTINGYDLAPPTLPEVPTCDW